MHKSQMKGDGEGADERAISDADVYTKKTGRGELVFVRNEARGSCSCRRS